MSIYITTVLILAGLQSFCKLALIPRKWELLTALMVFGLPFCFEERIARTNLPQMVEALSAPATLTNWCALVVIQELLAMVAGGALLAELQAEKNKLPQWKKYLSYWKYFAFLPSLLLPTGEIYLQMYLFNTLVDWKFSQITLLVAIMLPLILLLVSESLRFILRTQEKRILGVVHGEYLLLLPAIFLPVAANAKFIPASNEILPQDALYLLLGFAVFESITITIFYFLRRARRNVYHHSNS